MRSRRPSAQTAAVLLALAERPAAWRYGYDLLRQTGLQAGTLYPILMRLADQGLLEKPFGAATLLERVRSLLDRAQTH